MSIREQVLKMRAQFFPCCLCVETTYDVLKGVDCWRMAMVRLVPHLINDADIQRFTDPQYHSQLRLCLGP